MLWTKLRLLGLRIAKLGFFVFTDEKLFFFIKDDLNFLSDDSLNSENILISF